ncbi:hypothetical protein V5T82_00185 [Magnetovibrio sp. PR-2]|uniref:hypothetical protein n=1 Tax=Magnetovibrio sp. PR-2 TaxID=3120356 RepID=UPI002FCE3B99
MTDTDTAATVPPTTPADEGTPFVQTAMAAANLIELLRAHPEAYAFLEALLKCLKPPQSTSSGT